MSIRTRSAASRRGRHGRRGQALVEFAMVAPIFFLILLGILEAGRFIFYYETLHNATREGARYAIVNGTNTIGCSTGPAAPGTTSCDPAGNDVRDRVRDAAFGVLSPLTVEPYWCRSGEVPPACTGDNGRGMTVTVSASYTYRTFVPLVPLPDITVTAESSLVVNN